MDNRFRTTALKRDDFHRSYGSLLQLLLAIVITVIAFYPIYWMLISSVKSQDEILQLRPTFWPREFHFENYTAVLRKGNFPKYYFNTIVMTFGILASQIVTGIFAAYGFSKGHFPYRDKIFLLVLGALMIPVQVTFIPLYIMFARFNLTDTFTGLILPSAVSPYYIFMLRQTFMSIDDSYIDAAKIDGLGKVGIITRVLTPMCRSTLFTVTLVTFTTGWNSYFWPKIIAKEESHRVLTVGLAKLRDTFAGQGTMNNHEIMAGAVLAIIPVVILFFIFQKYMLSGYSKAAMK
ncbi:carbohydrate ABC transporter permease [Treponema sp. SP13]|uniref:carbohydrate ABC transporter permease n=1 Tax=Treponema sp. SP13 TaxID=2789742 RepID=UPI003D931DA6